MALTSTTLAGAITATQTEFLVTSPTGFEVGHLLKVDSEFLLILAIDTTTYWVRVQRGQNGTLPVAHNILALAIVGDPYDFLVPIASRLYTYGVNGAITVGPGLHRLVKGSAASMTLRAPRADEEGVTFTLIAASAYAHAIKLDSGNFNGTSDPEIVLNGAIGDCVELIAVGGSWCLGITKNYLFPSRSASISPSVSVSPSKSPSLSPSASA